MHEDTRNVRRRFDGRDLWGSGSSSASKKACSLQDLGVDMVTREQCLCESPSSSDSTALDHLLRFFFFCLFFFLFSSLFHGLPVSGKSINQSLGASGTRSLGPQRKASLQFATAARHTRWWDPRHWVTRPLGIGRMRLRRRGTSGHRAGLGSIYVRMLIWNFLMMATVIKSACFQLLQ